MAATLNDFLSEAVNIIESSARVISTNPDSIETLEAHVIILSALLTNTRRVSTRFNCVDRLSIIIEEIIRCFQEQKRTLHPEMGFFAPTQPGNRGRPLYVIARNQLEYFRDNGFTTKQMAGMLHVSQSSVKRRLRLYGLNIRQRYSTITDEELDERVTQITQDNNALGQRMVQGMLQAEGLHVQRHRVAECLIRVNELAVAMRWCTSIRRRVYQVSGPNALWHIDGNHKLIRWGFVIHGGIDGFSRVVTFLKVALNNRSETMQQAFFSGTDIYGVPSRVRSDHGLENVGVGAFMIAHRGANRGSFITGRSVHNQRIERLWRDMFQSCTNVFHRLFHHLENSLQLDLSEDVQLWCLQYVYIPRIQRALDRFREAWNHHKMTSEKGRSPHQLFIEGIFRNAGNGQRGVNDILYEPPNETLDQPENEYGVENESHVSESHAAAIEPPVVNRPLNNDSYERLCETIDPLDGDGLGVELYSQALEFCVANRA